MAGLLAACSGGSAQQTPNFTLTPVASQSTPEILPIFVSSEIVLGRNRFLFSLTDGQRNLISAPDLNVQLELFSREGDQGTKLADVPAEFLWAVEGERGLYVAYPEFPSAGRYGFRFLANREGEPVMTVLADFDVAAEATTPAIGEPAIPSDTPTADDVGGDLSQISTDESPDPSMYEVSVAQAIEAGEPFVVTFATPKLCTSRVCGPTLETVKAVKADYPDLRFIHVEPYDLTDQSELTTMPWVDEWGMPSEPWVFVVDADGNVAAKFEVIPGEGELRDAIDEVVGS
ncbi:MAG: TlpA family protein disulfide reductase [Candidatus Limnocylindria bacterium]